MKKVLSLVLVIAMVLSSMSFAFAGTFEDIADTDYTKAIETLTALGVVTGYEDGTYRPEKTVTRAEMAKLMVELLGYGDLVAGSKSNFTDTQGHWADAYIALAAGKGLVVGTGDGKFTPDRTVSYDEAITMVVRALGYTDACNEIKNMTWPTNFKVKAAELDLTDDVKMSTTGADRGGVAQLLYNALEAVLVTINSDGDVVKTEDKDGEYVELLSRLASLDTEYDVYPDRLDADDDDYAGDIVDLTSYMYQTLKVYLNDDDEVVYVKSNLTSTLTGTVTGVDEVNATITLEDADGEEYTIETTKTGDTSGTITAFYNGDEDTITLSEYDELLYTNGATNAPAKITVIGTTDDNVADGDFAEKFVVEKATEGILVDTDYVAGKSKISGDIGTIVLPEDSDGDVDVDAITVTGAVDSLEEIVEGNVVIAYESLDGDLVKLVVANDSVEGKVTKTNDGATTVYVDGTKYSLSKVANSVRYEEDVVVGDEGVFYLDNAGKIFAVDTEGAELTDYALVLDTEVGTYTSRLDGSVDEYPAIKLLTQDGDTAVYNVFVEVKENDSDVVILDDSATYTDDENEVDDEDMLELDTDSTVANDINFVPELADNTLVKYSVDEDGYIDEIEIIETESELIDLDDIDSIVADDVIVFNTVDEEVSSVDNLIDNETHEVVYSSGDIVVIVTDQIESANDGVFGVINAVNYVLNDDGDKVVEFTAFVDGEEVTYYSESGVTIGGNVTDTTTASAYKFDFNTSDEVEHVVAIVDGSSNDGTLTISGTATAVSSTKITIDGTTKYFTGDCVVYIYDESDEEITIGDISDLEEDAQTTAYVLDVDSTSRVGIVVQVQP